MHETLNFQIANKYCVACAFWNRGDKIQNPKHHGNQHLCNCLKQKRYKEAIQTCDDFEAVKMQTENEPLLPGM